MQTITKANCENSRKRPTFAKERQLAPHATSGALWCQKISGKWSLCSPRVAREARWGCGRREKTGLCQFFPFSSRFVFFKMKYLQNRKSKFRTVFTFEILASRSSKLDPMLINFEKLFFSYFQYEYDCVSNCIRA